MCSSTRFSAADDLVPANRKFAVYLIQKIGRNVRQPTRCCASPHVSEQAVRETCTRERAIHCIHSDLSQSFMLESPSAETCDDNRARNEVGVRSRHNHCDVSWV